MGILDRQWHSAADDLPVGARLLAAVSGGQDSLCLLSLLVDSAPERSWQVHVGHLDHRWRTDSTEAAQKVAILSATWGLPFHLAIADRPPANEAVARAWRYQWLGELAQSLGIGYVLTGHTQSDRAETFLFNLLRGCGSDGLNSLERQRPLRVGVQLVRPLLEVTRAQTAEFCALRQLPVAIDRTNFDLKYRRNRIREQLLPYLQEHFNPQVELALVRTAEILAAEADYIDTQVDLVISQLVKDDRLNRHDLATLPLALRRRATRRWLQQCGHNPNFQHVALILACLEAPNRTRTAPLFQGYSVEVQGQWLGLVR